MTPAPPVSFGAFPYPIANSCQVGGCAAYLPGCCRKGFKILNVNGALFVPLFNRSLPSATPGLLNLFLLIESIEKFKVEMWELRVVGCKLIAVRN